MKFNWKNKRFVQYQLEFYQEKKLTYPARELYSCIYNHCIFYSNENHDGWCGFSNEKLADKLGSTTRTIERSLKELKDKNMIIIENPRKYSKITGESRQIHINAKNYVVEEVPEDGNDELLKVIERQSKELEELKKENNRLRREQAQSTYITVLGHSLIRMGFITEEQYQKQAEELNHILLDFESWHKEGRELTKACFSYWNAHKDSYIKNPVQYILKCIDESKKWINKKDITIEDYNERIQKDMEDFERLNNDE